MGEQTKEIQLRLKGKQDMDLYRIILPKDSDWEIMSELGQIGGGGNGTSSQGDSPDRASQHNSGVYPGAFSSVAASANNRRQQMEGNGGRNGGNNQASDQSSISTVSAYQFAKGPEFNSTQGIIQFLDMNLGQSGENKDILHKHRQRYFNQMRRAEETEKVIEELESYCNEFGVRMRAPHNVGSFLRNVNQWIQTATDAGAQGAPPGQSLNIGQAKKAPRMLFDDIEQDVVAKRDFLRKQRALLKEIIRDYGYIGTRINVLQSAWAMLESEGAGKQLNFPSNTDLQAPDDLKSPLLGGALETVKIGYIGGTIHKGEQMTLKRLVFRAMRGQAFTYFFEVAPSDLADSLLLQQGFKDKLVFIILYHQGDYIYRRLRKICETVTSDPVVDVRKEQIASELQNLRQQRLLSQQLIVDTRKQLREYLETFNRSEHRYSEIQIMKWFVIKEKMICAELNKLEDGGEKILTGLFWCPRKYRDLLEMKVAEIKSKRNLMAGGGPQISQLDSFDETIYVRPTLIETNEFTWPFQEIVNTYGVPLYKELNPAVFTAVTFPFLFGVMFGDVFHGVLLLFFALYLCLNDFQPGTALRALAKIRYLLLLMGFFSTYCGYIYNDFTSMPLEAAGPSCYDINLALAEGRSQIPLKNQECVYSMGVDPAWYMAHNELTYFNSLKMKVAVILGVAQMTLGVILKGLNYRYQGKRVDFYFEFVPQLVMLLALFGFMDLLIVLKWLTDFSGVEGGPSRAPSIITTMITMALGFGEQSVSAGKVKDHELIPGGWQTPVMRILVVVILICVPTMLLVKPLHQLRQMKKKHRGASQTDEEGQQRGSMLPRDSSLQPRSRLVDTNQVYYAINADENEQNWDEVDLRASSRGGTVTSNVRESVAAEREQRIGESKSHQTDQEEHSFSDIFIHQLIETIEFVLGTVSNTASYLRLWALSLAHSQLAKVFFENTLKSGLQSGSFLTLFLGYFVFIVFTIGVLMCMDLMEAFLHTLRLHWVEFQNKFYRGGGLKFAPYSIEAALLKAQEKAVQEQAKQVLIQRQKVRSAKESRRKSVRVMAPNEESRSPHNKM